MGVSEKFSGIVDSHIGGIERAARSENTFIFVRPTEFDSTILIRAGYATKSMDVHHKSSNWGPMAGFVPCDPAFSKKCLGSPNSMENEKKHGAAHPMQLTLKSSLLSEHTKIQFPSGFVLQSAKGGSKQGINWSVKRQIGKGAVSSAKQKFEAFEGSGGAIPEHKFCTALPTESGVKSTLFCLIKKAGEWLVYWVEWKGEIGNLHPLRVFSYPLGGRLNPVTGDYDLWMVAPHFKNFDKHAIVRLEKDKHGASAASGFTMNLMQKMNANCGRAKNHVFHHGAEAQNYGFTQALDWDLAMFTPSGSSRMVRMNQMPKILSDMQSAGYLVVVNKRYSEVDPHLSSKPDARGASTLSGIRSEIEKLYGELDTIKRTANPAQIAKSVQQNPKRMPDTMRSEISKMADRFSQSRNLGHEQSRMHKFNLELKNLIASQKINLRVLRASDFPPSYQKYQRDILTSHLQLQSAMVNATVGKGQSDENLLKTVAPIVRKLKEHWR